MEEGEEVVREEEVREEEEAEPMPMLQRVVEPSLLSSPRLGLGRSLFSTLWRGPRAPALNRSLGRQPVVAPLLPVGGGLGVGRELRSGTSGRAPMRIAQLPWVP